jgi:hypothetical protein
MWCLRIREKECCKQSRSREISCVQQEERALTGLAISCLLKHIIEGKKKERTEVTEKRRSRHKQLLDDLKEREDSVHCKRITI